MKRFLLITLITAAGREMKHALAGSCLAMLFLLTSPVFGQAVGGEEIQANPGQNLTLRTGAGAWVYVFGEGVYSFGHVGAPSGTVWGSFLYSSGLIQADGQIIGQSLSVADQVQASGQITGQSFFSSTNVSTNVLTIRGGSDLAENFGLVGRGGAEALPGMVVAIDPAGSGALRISDIAYDRTVAGVISGAGGLQAGMRMGQDGSIADGDHPVALTGRVYVWADASQGAISAGDLLTSSATPGHAMRVVDHQRAQGAILGKAMTPLAGERGLVLMLISLQ